MKKNCSHDHSIEKKQHGPPHRTLPYPSLTKAGESVSSRSDSNGTALTRAWNPGERQIIGGTEKK